jgi:hypothetical protein
MRLTSYLEVLGQLELEILLGCRQEESTPPACTDIAGQLLPMYNRYRELIFTFAFSMRDGRTD